jgi:radical SAM protein with 4Fe4S-binding SPASM domain
MIVPLKSLLKALFIYRFSLTLRRMVNLIKIYLSMGLSYSTGKQFVWGYPVFLMIEPTNICNLKCPMCPSGTGDMKRSRGRLSFENYRRVIDDVGGYILQLQLWNQGEPFLNASLLDFIRYAKGKGIMVQTSTNGHFIKTEEDAQALVDSGLDQIIFSMDGTNQESYARYRIGGNFNLVLETLERIGRAKVKLKSKTPLVELQFLVFNYNQKEIENLIKIAKETGVNRISFKSAQVYSREQADAFLPSDGKYARYSIQDGAIKIKSDLKNWCKRLWLNSTVNWDGSIVPCCFDKDNTYAFANVFNNGKISFRKSWQNERYKSFRNQVLTQRANISMCTNCTEGMKEPYTTIVELKDLSG